MTGIEAARKVLEGFDADVFVRDVSHDGVTGWALRAAPYLVALARLQDFAQSDGASPEPSQTATPSKEAEIAALRAQLAAVEHERDTLALRVRDAPPVS